MDYVTIPNTELTVPGLTLGTWVFGGMNWGGADEKSCIRTVHAARDAGMNMIDTAPIYGKGRSEEIVGKAIKEQRDKYIVATKCGLLAVDGGIQNNLQPESIRRELEGSLKRLNTDYIDIYQCHWPDPDTDIEVTMDCLKSLCSEGKIRHIGVSNFDGKLLARAHSVAAVVTLQSQYSMLVRDVERSILPFCRQHGIGFLAYGPLAGGILTGKYRKPQQFKPQDVRSFFYKYYFGKGFERVQTLLKTLDEIGRPLNQTAINWVRQTRGVSSVLVGCRNPEQVASNAAACDWTLSDEQVESIAQALRGLDDES
ncbi:MAG: aldo/keto reductase [Candidatus Omnitrophota bacterium]